MSRGDHMIVGRGLYTHHGIDLGDGTVVHYSGLADGLRAGPVARVSREEFCGGETPRVRRHPKAKWSPGLAAQRALERVGETNYHLVWCNCESFCQWAHTDKEWSLQVLAFVGVGALAAAGLAVAGVRGRVGRGFAAAAAGCIGAAVATPQIVSRAWSVASTADQVSLLGSAALLGGACARFPTPRGHWCMDHFGTQRRLTLGLVPPPAM